MNIIKILSFISINFLALQLYGMSVESCTPIKKYPTFEELKKRYSFNQGIIWDPAMFDSAQETGYMPTEVLVYDWKGNIKKRTIYHGAHIIAVQLSRYPFWRNIRIPGKNISASISQMLYEKNIKHPVILASHKSSHMHRYSPGNYTVVLNERSKSLLFELGHELGHCKLHNEILFNPPTDDRKGHRKKLKEYLKNTEQNKRYIYHKRNELNKEYRHSNDKWIRIPYLEEYYCDEVASNILGTTPSEKMEIIKQGIDFFKNTIKEHGDIPSNSHPRPSKRLQRLKQQLASIQE